MAMMYKEREERYYCDSDFNTPAERNWNKYVNDKMERRDQIIKEMPQGKDKEIAEKIQSRFRLRKLDKKMTATIELEKVYGLYISNINMESQNIRDIFSKYGEITKIEIERDEELPNKGHGYILFTALSDAYKASKMHSSSLNVTFVYYLVHWVIKQIHGYCFLTGPYPAEDQNEMNSSSKLESLRSFVIQYSAPQLDTKSTLAAPASSSQSTVSTAEKVSLRKRIKALLAKPVPKKEKIDRIADMMLMIEGHVLNMMLTGAELFRSKVEQTDNCLF